MPTDFTLQVAGLPLHVRHGIAKRAAAAITERVSGPTMLVRSARMYRHSPDDAGLATLCVAMLVTARGPGVRRRSETLRRLDVLCPRTG